MAETTLTNKPTAQELIAKLADKRLPVENRVDTIRQLMLANKDKLARGMVGTLTPERAIQVACNSIRKNPALLDCTPASLFGCISEANTYGWACDGVTGEAALVPFQNRKKGCSEATLIPGYKGWIKLVNSARECLVSIESVHEGDEFTFNDRWAKPSHIRSTDPQRRFRPVIGAYVVAIFNGGQVKCFYWSVGECIAHRDHYSQNWKRSPREDNPWHEKNPAFRTMCMKTVLLDAVHRGELPTAIERERVAEFMRRDTAVETGETTTESILPDAHTIDVEPDKIEARETSDTAPHEPSEDAVGWLVNVDADLAQCESIGDVTTATKAALLAASELAMSQADRDWIASQIVKESAARTSAIKGKRGAGSNK